MDAIAFGGALYVVAADFVVENSCSRYAMFFVWSYPDRGYRVQLFVNWLYPRWVAGMRSVRCAVGQRF